MGKFSIEVKWALIFFVMMLVWTVIEKSTGLHTKHIDVHSIYTNLVAIPAIMIYVFALLDKKKNFYFGKMSYKESFISGLTITLILTALSPLSQYITSEIISPDYYQNVINYSVSVGKLSHKEAMENFNLKNYMITSLISTFLFGIITTAIVSIFVKTKRRHHR